MKQKTRTGKRISMIILAMIILVSIAIVGISSTSAASVDVANTSAGATKTIYFSPNGNWSNLFAVYAWQDADSANGEWYSLTKLSSADGVYSADISDAYNKVIFCSRTTPVYSWSAVDNKTDELTIPDDCNYLTLTGSTTATWGYFGNGADGTAPTQTVYFTPCEEWMDIQNYSFHEFAAHAYNESHTADVLVQMTLVEGEYGSYPSVWAAEIPEDFTTVEFSRIEGSVDDGDYVVWETTDEQRIPEFSNLFTQNNSVATGTWSAYTPSDDNESGGGTNIPSIPSDPEEDKDLGDTKTVYFTPNETWTSFIDDSIASISVYSWGADSTNGVWQWMEVANAKANIYFADIPVDHTCVLFGLSYSDSPDVVWVQVDDQIIPASKNYFTQDATGEDGTWGLYSGNSATYYSVTFIDADGTFIKSVAVAEGEDAIAPAAPSKAADAQYTYTFSGWDTSYSNITCDTVVRATYIKTINTYKVTFLGKDGTVLSTQYVNYGDSASAPTAPAVAGYTFTGWNGNYTLITANTTVTAMYTAKTATGTLKIDIVAGSGMYLTVNNGATRPQGPSYINTSMAVGAKVTVKAVTTNSNAFVGWVNTADNKLLSTDLTYSFYTSGNDNIKALYNMDFPSLKLVSFYNNKTNQYIDMQYYLAGDSITFPATEPVAAGWIFKGWNMTEAQIQAEIVKGNNCTVTPVWEREIVYVNVIVNGGTATGTTNADGKFLSGTAVTITADSAPAGMKFAYWKDSQGNIKSYETTYKLYPATDTSMTAVFVAVNETVEYKVLASVDTFVATSYGQFTISWYVPTEQNNYTYVASGIIAVDSTNYDAETFVHGSGDANIYDRTSTSKTPSGTYVWTGPVASGQTWYAKAWVQYIDDKGVIQTVYSDMYVAIKE